MLASKSTGILRTLINETKHIQSNSQLKAFIRDFRFKNNPSCIDRGKYERGYGRQKFKLELEILQAADLSRLNSEIISTIEDSAAKPEYKYEKYNKIIQGIKRKEKMDRLKAKINSKIKPTQLMEFISVISETEQEQEASAQVGLEVITLGL